MMQPKIVFVLVLGTPEQLESGLILQNWPYVMAFALINAQDGLHDKSENIKLLRS